MCIYYKYNHITYTVTKLHKYEKRVNEISKCLFLKIHTGNYNNTTNKTSVQIHMYIYLNIYKNVNLIIDCFME